MSIYQRISVSIIYLVIPWLYAINPYLGIGLLVIQLIILSRTTNDLGSNFTVLFLNGLLYSSFSILNLRIYDFVIVIFALLLIIQMAYNSKFIRIPKSVIFFSILLFLLTLIHPWTSDSLMEIIRYMFSLMCVLIVYNFGVKFDEVKNFLSLIPYVAIYNSLIVFWLSLQGHIEQLNSHFFSSNIYIYNQQINGDAEVRLNGFFSDPNKYMTFCFLLLILVELFYKTEKFKLELVIMFASVISLSRTAILAVVAFLIAKQMYHISKKSTSIFLFEVCLVIVLAIIAILIPDFINNILNGAYYFSARLLGRLETLQINPTFESDNRIYIWNQAIDLIQNKFLFGYGWLSTVNLLPYPTHNTILQLIMDGGIVYLIGYVLFFKPMYFIRQWYLVLSCYLVPTLLLELADYRAWFMLLGVILFEEVNNRNGKDIYIRAN